MAEGIQATPQKGEPGLKQPFITRIIIRDGRKGSVFRTCAASDTIGRPGALALDSGSAMTSCSTFGKLLTLPIS